jgi:hypothetical protein
MKKLLLKTLACAAILLPFSLAQAKTFGSFQPNKTFTLKVESVTGIKQKVGGIPVTTANVVPAGLPKFKVGQVLKFKIGAKGQLIGKGFSIPYRAGLSNTAAGINVYQDPKKSKPSTREVTFASVTQSNNVVEVGTLDFSKIKVNGASASVTRVLYGLSNE